MTQDGSGKRIVITTFGSFGDVHPYLPVALELKARGHRPAVATLPLYREKVEALGITFHPVRPDLPPPEQAVELIGEAMDAKTGTEFIFKTMITPHLRDSYDDLCEAARGADLLITHPITLAGPLVAQKMKLPWASTVLSPASLFSIYDPPVVPLPSVLSKLPAVSPVIARLLFSYARRRLEPWIEPVRRLRAELGLPPGGHPVFEGQHSPELVLALFSSVLARPQPDWPPHTHITGFPFYDRRDERGISSDLLRFLDAGPPPIVFTLGSSAVWVAGDFYRESIVAARKLGRRAVLLVGDTRNLPPEPLPDNIVAFDYAPYGEILPRASAVVHQGGIGTTAQSLRAGKPMLVVPYSHDQPDNAARVARLGVGRAVPRPRYTAARAAKELSILLDDPSYAMKAAEVARRVRSEDGARSACDLIEELLSKMGGPGPHEEQLIYASSH